MATEQLHAVGRRKEAVCRVYITPGTGKWEINGGRTLGDYFPRPSLVSSIQQPFAVTDTIGGYDVQLAGVKDTDGANYTATVAEMRVTRGGALITTQYPEKRFYPVQGMPTTEAAIHQGLTRDLYFVIGDPQKDGGWAVRAYVKPFADWIWAGTLLMALGGLVSLTDRRYRAAAGASRSAPKGLPAE